MRTVVVYDSSFGNTARIAQAIARGVGTSGPAQVINAAEAAPLLPERPDLLLVGCPTQKHGLSPALRAFADALPSRSLGVLAAS